MKIGLGVSPQACSIRAHNSRKRAEFCQRQEFVGIGGKPRIDHALRILKRNAGALQRAQIGDA